MLRSIKGNQKLRQRWWRPNPSNLNSYPPPTYSKNLAIGSHSVRGIQVLWKKHTNNSQCATNYFTPLNPCKVCVNRHFLMAIMKDDGGCSVSVTVTIDGDELYEVDIERREVYPIYWDGPRYQVCSLCTFHSIFAQNLCDFPNFRLGVYFNSDHCWNFVDRIFYLLSK